MLAGDWRFVAAAQRRRMAGVLALRCRCEACCPDHGSDRIRSHLQEHPGNRGVCIYGSSHHSNSIPIETISNRQPGPAVAAEREDVAQLRTSGTGGATRLTWPTDRLKLQNAGPGEGATPGLACPEACPPVFPLPAPARVNTLLRLDKKIADAQCEVFELG